MKGRQHRECAAALARVSAYLDGEITPAQRRAVERHCRSCARCESLAAGLCRTVRTCHQAGRARVPEIVRKKAIDNIRQLLGTERRQQRRPKRR